MKRILLSIIMAATAVFVAQAQEEEVNGIRYLLNDTDNTAKTIQKGGFYPYYSGNITIPASITVGDISYTVTAVGEYTFYNSSGLSSVTFSPDSQIQTIEEFAFAYSNLPSITIPNSVTRIDQHAFDDCSSLTDITVNWVNPNILVYGNNIFIRVDVASVKLYVPAGTVADYRAIATWQDFDIIDTATGIKDIGDDNNIIRYEYFNITGQKLNEKPAKGYYIESGIKENGSRTSRKMSAF